MIINQKYYVGKRMEQFVDLLNDTAAKDLLDALTADLSDSKCFRIEKDDTGDISIQNAAGAYFHIKHSSISNLIELLRNKSNIPNP